MSHLKTPQTSWERSSQSSTIHRLGWAVSHSSAALQGQHDPADPSLQHQGISLWWPPLEEQRPLSLRFLCCPLPMTAGLVGWGGLMPPEEPLGTSLAYPHQGKKSDSKGMLLDFHSQLPRKPLLLPPFLDICSTSIPSKQMERFRSLAYKSALDKGALKPAGSSRFISLHLLRSLW